MSQVQQINIIIFIRIHENIENQFQNRVAINIKANQLKKKTQKYLRLHV